MNEKWHRPHDKKRTIVSDSVRTYNNSISFDLSIEVCTEEGRGKNAVFKQEKIQSINITVEELLEKELIDKYY